jgi:hypothetical protein
VTKYTVTEKGWSIDSYVVEANSEKEAIEMVANNEVEIESSDFTYTEIKAQEKKDDEL